MTILKLILIIVINLAIQSTILPYWTIFGYAPNTALICVVALALLKGKYYGGFFGLAIGLVQDILFSSVIGVNALVYFLIGYTIGLVEGKLDTNNTIVPVVVTAIATVAYNFIYFFLLFFLSRQEEFILVVRKMFSIEIIYNSLVSILIYKLFSRMFEKPTLSFGGK